MAESKPKVGDTISAKGEVTFPDGVTRKVDGHVVLDQPGTFVIDGSEVTVK